MQLISIKNIKASIFDIDGTMVMNKKYHADSWKEFFRRHGFNLNPQQLKDLLSGRKRNTEMLAELFEQPISKKKLKEYSDEKERIYRKLYKGHVKPVKGLFKTIKVLRKRNLRLAVASSAIKPNREFILKELNLVELFDIVVGEEEVRRVKPHPDLFLETANRLRISPHECIVFEDSPAGVQAGKSVGMKVIALLTGFPKEQLLTADYLIKDFREIKLT